jgi:predicted MPP superfamily phosphohydrolase
MKKGETHFFVSSGIRLWGPPVRTTGKSEILVIDIALTAKAGNLDLFQPV